MPPTHPEPNRGKRFFRPFFVSFFRSPFGTIFSSIWGPLGDPEILPDRPREAKKVKIDDIFDAPVLVTVFYWFPSRFFIDFRCFFDVFFRSVFEKKRKMENSLKHHQ